MHANNYPPSRVSIHPQDRRPASTLDMAASPQDDSNPDSDAIMRFAELLMVTLVSRSKAYELMNPKSPYYDVTFPVGFPLYDSPRSPKAWYRSEALAWVAGRAKKHKTRQEHAA